jgi:hypothetical protein
MNLTYLQWLGDDAKVSENLPFCFFEVTFIAQETDIFFAVFITQQKTIS